MAKGKGLGGDRNGWEGEGRGEERGGEGETGGGEGGAREGAKIGWLMLYDTWSQLIDALSCIMGVGGGGEGKEAVVMYSGEAGDGEGDTERGQRLAG